MDKNNDYQSEELKEMIRIFTGLDSKFKYVRTNMKFSSEGYDETLDAYRKDIDHIHQALKNLSVIDSYIITETFHHDGKVSNTWWKGLYKKSTFYRMRSRAINAFLKEYHQIC